MAVLNSLPASSASVECLFSTLGFVQNKVRNRLGNDKTEKLVKCHQLLKSKCEEDWQKLSVCLKFSMKRKCLV